MDNRNPLNDAKSQINQNHQSGGFKSSESQQPSQKTAKDVSEVQVELNSLNGIIALLEDQIMTLHMMLSPILRPVIVDEGRAGEIANPAIMSPIADTLHSFGCRLYYLNKNIIELKQQVCV